MITISKAKADLDNSKRYLDENVSEMKKNQVSSHEKKIAFLVLVHNYLKSSQDEKFVIGEISRLSKRQNIINVGYDVRAKTPQPKQFKNDKEKLKYFQKENGIPKLKIQLKALKFIAGQ